MEYEIVGCEDKSTQTDFQCTLLGWLKKWLYRLYNNNATTDQRETTKKIPGS